LSTNGIDLITGVVTSDRRPLFVEIPALTTGAFA
jgi:hypothetical protein